MPPRQSHYNCNHLYWISLDVSQYDRRTVNTVVTAKKHSMWTAWFTQGSITNVSTAHEDKARIYVTLVSTPDQIRKAVEGSRTCPTSCSGFTAHGITLSTRAKFLYTNHAIMWRCEGTMYFPQCLGYGVRLNTFAVIWDKFQVIYNL